MRSSPWTHLSDFVLNSLILTSGLTSLSSLRHKRLFQQVLISWNLSVQIPGRWMDFKTGIDSVVSGLIRENDAEASDTLITALRCSDPELFQKHFLNIIRRHDDHKVFVGCCGREGHWCCSHCVLPLLPSVQLWGLQEVFWCRQWWTAQHAVRESLQKWDIKTKYIMCVTAPTCWSTGVSRSGLTGQFRSWIVFNKVPQKHWLHPSSFQS